MATAVKICGITRLEDAQACLDAGVDAIGLVFAEQSKRYIDPKQALPIAQMVAGRLQRVGMFVDAPEATVRAVMAAVPLDILQFHGNEPPDYCASFGLPYCKAVPAAADFDAAACEQRYAQADYLLLDAVLDGQFGGTGSGFDWSLWPASASSRATWVLAGGLNVANVATAVSRLQPCVVDVSSGVEVFAGPDGEPEAAPDVEGANPHRRIKGLKDAQQIRAFVASVRRAARLND